MLMQIFSQIVGNLVLVSLAATLFLYVGFKRHQQNYKDYLTSITGYGSIIVTMAVLFSTYFKSVELRFTLNTETPTSQEDSTFNTQSVELDIIDTRPFHHCDTTPILKWRPDCVLRSLESRSRLDHSSKSLASHSTKESEEL